jgi:GDPmannose 4,6-dehydratase
MWRIMQQQEPNDYVLATGITTSVRDFTTQAFAVGGIEIRWQGTREAEVGKDAQTGAVCVQIDPQYYRPTEVDLLLGYATKAREKLGWQPVCDLQQLVQEMVEEDLRTP